MKRTILVMLMTFAVIVTAAPVTPGSSQSTITYYDGLYEPRFFGPTGEIVEVDLPTLGSGSVSPGPYPYEFNLTEPLHVLLQIRHFLWNPGGGLQNNLTINLDNAPILEINFLLPLPHWYPGGDGIDLIDLGTVPAGTHNITMSATLPNYYAMDWFKVLELVYDVAVINVVPANSWAYPTWTVPLEITVTVLNNGTDTASFSVTAYNDTTAIETQTVNDLAAGAQLNLTFSWALSGVAYGDHAIKANATPLDPPVPDINPGNNEKEVTVRVRWPGDCDDSGFVDLDDHMIFLASWFKGVGQEGYDPRADFTGSGFVDLDDFMIFLANWFTGP